MKIKFTSLLSKGGMYIIQFMNILIHSILLQRETIALGKVRRHFVWCNLHQFFSSILCWDMHPMLLLTISIICEIIMDIILKDFYQAIKLCKKSYRLLFIYQPTIFVLIVHFPMPWHFTLFVQETQVVLENWIWMQYHSFI